MCLVLLLLFYFTVPPFSALCYKIPSKFEYLRRSLLELVRDAKTLRAYCFNNLLEISSAIVIDCSVVVVYLYYDDKVITQKFVHTGMKPLLLNFSTSPLLYLSLLLLPE